MTSDVLVIVAAHNEADRIEGTLAALARALPDAHVWVADDGSHDSTAAIAGRAGARIASSGRVIGKGGAVTLAARAALVAEHVSDDALVLLCDGDLAESAACLGPLLDAVRDGEADLTVAAFARRIGGGLGLALGFSGWAIRRRCGLRARAPISGQRAMRVSTLRGVLPFAHGYGMEIGMTIDAVRQGARVKEIDLDLSHRATGRTLGGFVHRGRQLIDFVRVYAARR